MYGAARPYSRRRQAVRTMTVYVVATSSSMPAARASSSVVRAFRCRRARVYRTPPSRPSAAPRYDYSRHRVPPRGQWSAAPTSLPRLCPPTRAAVRTSSCGRSRARDRGCLRAGQARVARWPIPGEGCRHANAAVPGTSARHPAPSGRRAPHSMATPVRSLPRCPPTRP